MNGLIYVIGSEDFDALKIGFTSRAPRMRLAALQTGCPFALKIRALVEGNESEERALHARWRAHKMIGEWFLPTSSLLHFVETISRDMVDGRPASNGLLYGMGYLKRRSLAA